MAKIAYRRITIDGLEIFYREAGGPLHEQLKRADASSGTGPARRSPMTWLVR